MSNHQQIKIIITDSKGNITFDSTPLIVDHVISILKSSLYMLKPNEKIELTLIGDK